MNIRDVRGWTPLHVAAYLGHTAAVKVLLENNADMELKDKQGNQPIHLAAKKGNIEYVNLLCTHTCT